MAVSSSHSGLSANATSSEKPVCTVLSIINNPSIFYFCFLDSIYNYLKLFIFMSDSLILREFLATSFKAWQLNWSSGSQIVTVNYWEICAEWILKNQLSLVLKVLWEAGAEIRHQCTKLGKKVVGIRERAFPWESWNYAFRITFGTKWPNGFRQI